MHIYSYILYVSVVYSLHRWHADAVAVSISRFVYLFKVYFNSKQQLHFPPCECMYVCVRVSHFKEQIFSVPRNVFRCVQLTNTCSIIKQNYTFVCDSFFMVSVCWRLFKKPKSFSCNDEQFSFRSLVVIWKRESKRREGVTEWSNYDEDNLFKIVDVKWLMCCKVFELSNPLGGIKWDVIYK